MDNPKAANPMGRANCTILTGKRGTTIKRAVLIAPTRAKKDNENLENHLVRFITSVEFIVF